MTAYGRAMELYNGGAWVEAVKAFEEAFRQLGDPSHPYGELARFYHREALIRSGLAREETGDLEGARRDLETAIASGSTFPDTHFHHGRLLARAGRWDEALAAFDRALAWNPSYADAKGWRGVVLWKTGRTAEARDELRGAVGAGLELPDPDPRDTPPGAWIAAVEGILSRRREAEVQIREASAAVRAGDRKTALERLERAVAQRPSYPDLRCRLGILLLNEERCEEALLNFDRALDVNPRYTEARIQRGVARIRLDRPEEAVEDLLCAVRLEPDYLDGHLLVALALLRSGRFQEARDRLTTLMSEVPGENRGNYLLAAAHALLGDRFSAGRLLEKSARDGFLLPAVADQAWRHLRSGRFQECVDLVRRAGAHHGGDVRLDLLQGLGLLGLGAKEKARGILEGLVGSERREVARRAALALAGLEREEGRVEAGLATLDRAALATGTDGEILHLRGRLYEEDAELGSAVESYEGAARAGVGRPDVLFDLGRACLRDGRIGEGLARIREAWEKDPGLFPSAALGDPRLTDDL